MNRQSIFFTITVSFVISLLLLMVSFLVLITHNYKEREQDLLDRYFPIIKMVTKEERKFGITQEFIKNLQEVNYTLFDDMNKINMITYNPLTKVIIEKVHPHERSILRVLNLDDTNYIYMKRDNKTILIKDENTSNNSSHIYIFLVFGILFITVILIYLITLRKLMPLKIKVFIT